MQNTIQEKVKKQLDEIKKRKDLNIFLHLNESALEDAKRIDEKIRMKKAGRLAGMTFAIKANINVKGLPISCASKTLEKYHGTYDADCIKMVKEEDCIILGIANCDEFACGASGETSAFGPTKNPAAPDRIPGGSSSGSAAAVAAGLVDAALGSDTGGSIRNPASHCGVVGIKPSYGRVSRFGLIDLAMSLDQVGPLAQDAKTAALVLEVISGKSRNDCATTDNPVEKYSHSTLPKKLKIGMCREFADLCTDKRILELVLANAHVFAKATGSSIVEFHAPHLKLGVQTYYPLVYVEFFSGTRKFDGRRYGKKIEESCGEEVLRRILGGREISRAEFGGRYYRKALAVKEIVAKEFQKTFKSVDIIISPVTPRLPHRFGEKLSPLDMYAYDAFTIPANLAGICAGVVPTGKIDGIPVGIQVMAPAFKEKLLCDVMAGLEK